MNMIRWIIAGAVGAAIGTAVWVAVGYFSNYEVGWIAWGVGFLVGLGVRIGAGDEDGWLPGITATSIALASVLLAKYLVVSLLVSSAMAEFQEYRVTDPNEMVAVHADEVAEEFEQAGRPVVWPPDDESEDAPIETHYPPDVWAEAKRRWSQLSPEEQQAQTSKHEEEVSEAIELLTKEARSTAFQDSFTPWDLLWFGLAAVTAFKVGSGLASDEE